jgi:phospholipase A1/A2
MGRGLVSHALAALVVGAFASGGALAQSVPEAAAEPTPPEKVPERPGPGEKPREYGRLDFKVDPDVYSIVSQVRGLSTHKATYFYPASYSHEFDGDHTEMVFQVSAKWRVFGTNAYLAYSQRSFWQWLNGDESSPFRETNYDPEVFYRWIPDKKQFNHWGADFGFEHESNGREFPFSRSWNRVYLAPFQAKGKGLAYLKFWYRVPEGDRSTVTNQNGDDNPDLVDSMGYGELTYSRQIGGAQLITLMGRGNPDTGRGAVQVTWSMPSSEGWVFWGASVFHGYGESLIFYDQSVTRVMLGIMLAR